MLKKPCPETLTSSLLFLVLLLFPLQRHDIFFLSHLPPPPQRMTSSTTLFLPRASPSLSPLRSLSSKDVFCPLVSSTAFLFLLFSSLQQSPSCSLTLLKTHLFSPFPSPFVNLSFLSRLPSLYFLFLLPFLFLFLSFPHLLSLLSLPPHNTPFSFPPFLFPFN